MSSHTNPEKGPVGEDCIADVAWLGPEDASKLLILVSGTHGAEGYAGSGCQVAWPGTSNSIGRRPDPSAAIKQVLPAEVKKSLCPTRDPDATRHRQPTAAATGPSASAMRKCRRCMDRL